mgnify:CR=1 FL=1
MDSRTIIDGLNLPDSMVHECKDEKEWVTTYSGHWNGFDDEKLKVVYKIVKAKSTTETEVVSKKNK